jgi:hypothetical protein
VFKKEYLQFEMAIRFNLFQLRQHSILLKLGLWPLVAFIVLSFLVHCSSPPRQPLVSALNPARDDSVFFSPSGMRFHANYLKDSQGEDLLVRTQTDHEGCLQIQVGAEKLFTVTNPLLANRSLAFFGRLNTPQNRIYALDHTYQSDSCFLLRIDLDSQTVSTILLPRHFGIHSQKIGYSALDLFENRDTVYLTFSYPTYKHDPLDLTKLFYTTHLGIFAIQGRRAKFVNEFGNFAPHGTQFAPWRRPKVTFDPNNRRIIFTYYNSDKAFVFDFLGKYQKAYNLQIAHFDQSVFEVPHKRSDCIDKKPFHNWLMDSCIHIVSSGVLNNGRMYFLVSNRQAFDTAKFAIHIYNSSFQKEQVIQGFQSLSGLTGFRDGMYWQYVPRTNSVGQLTLGHPPRRQHKYAVFGY